MSKNQDTKHGRGKRFDGFRLPPEDLIIIGRDTKDGPEHWGYDPRGLRPFNENHVLGMMKYGILKPINIRRIGKDDIVVAGRGVVINAREANRRLSEAGQPTIMVPCLPRSERDDVSMFEIASIENNHRVEETALDLEARARKLHDSYHRSVDDIAVVLEKPVSTIRALLKLEDCSPTVRKLVARGDMGVTAAAKMAKLPHEEQDKEIKTLDREGAKPSARAVIDRVREKEGKKPIQTPARRLEEAAKTFRAIADDLSRALSSAESEGNIVNDVETRAMLDRLSVLLCGVALADLDK